MQYTATYSSPLGGITLASNGEQLTGLWFDGQKYFGSILGPQHEARDLPVFHEAARWLDLYFSGQDFRAPLDTLCRYKNRQHTVLIVRVFG